jgi:type II secretory pathway component PulF
MPDEPAPVPAAPSRALRIWYSVIQGVSLSVFVGLCWISKKFEEIFAQLEMRHLPAPTELVLAVAPLVRTPGGLFLLGAIGVALSILGIRGKFDRLLRKLIGINVLGTLGLMAFVVLSLFLPIIQIQHALEKK